MCGAKRPTFEKDLSIEENSSFQAILARAPQSFCGAFLFF
jgi:hypothetical protein